MKEIIKCIKHHRKTKSQRQLAKEIGISQTTLCRLESGGNRVPRLSNYNKIIKWYSIQKSIEIQQEGALNPNYKSLYGYNSPINNHYRYGFITRRQEIRNSSFKENFLNGDIFENVVIVVLSITLVVVLSMVYLFLNLFQWIFN